METATTNPEFIMEIVFDEEKILHEGKYDLADMYKIVDDEFAALQQKKIGKGKYASVGSRHDFARQMIFANKFKKLDWFFDNLTVWNWLERDDRDPDNYFSNDTLEHVKTHERYWA
ncbi:MAG: hypothetical protein LBN42_00255 [Oscillospiraceae bacterium]|jgi:hypothetical protein|nr:hypothetical protein [Oscillospiraceae bacterium]